MTKFFLRWIINAAALYAAIFLLDGHGVDFSGNWISIIWLGSPVRRSLAAPFIKVSLVNHMERCAQRPVSQK